MKNQLTIQIMYSTTTKYVTIERVLNSSKLIYA